MLLHFGLKTNHLLYKYDYIMTGYIANVELLHAVVETIRDIKTNSPHKVTYLCDPVMGDIWHAIADQSPRGKMYVSTDLLPIYQKDVLPLADILTPNQCELELLMNNTIIASSEQMVEVLLRKEFQDKLVVVTSNLAISEDIVTGFAKSAAGQVICFEVPRFPCSLVGTGDLFSANLLAVSHHSSSGDLSEILNSVLWSVYCVVEKTYEKYKRSGSVHWDSLELELIRCQDEIRYKTKNIQKHFKVDILKK